MGADGRRVVGAVDGDGDGLHNGAAVAVIDRDVVLLHQAIVRTQIVDRVVGDREAPAHRAGAAAGRIVTARNARGEGADIAERLRHSRNRMAVGQIDIGKRDGAAGALAAGLVAAALHPGVLGHRAVGVGADGRRVVRRVDGDVGSVGGGGERRRAAVDRRVHLIAGRAAGLVPGPEGDGIRVRPAETRGRLEVEPRVDIGRQQQGRSVRHRANG